MKKGIIPVLLTTGAIFSSGASPGASVRDALSDWMERQLPVQLEALQRRSEVPILRYGIRIDDGEVWTFSADRGGEIGSHQGERRELTALLVTGKPEFASTRPLQWFPLPPEIRGEKIDLPLRFSESHYSRALKQATEWTFRQTRDHYARLWSERETLIGDEEEGLDWAPVPVAPPTDSVPVRSSPDSHRREAIQEEILRLSERWKGLPWLHSSGIDFSWSSQLSRMVTSDGSPGAPLLWKKETTDLSVTFLTRTDDGLDLMEYRTWSFDSFPLSLDTSAIGKAIDSLLAGLEQLRQAEMGTPYAGPVLLEGEAAAVFVHEVLGHRLESHRLKQKSDGQTFLRKRGEKIAPPEVSLKDDPTLTHWDGVPLHGHYPMDDEGTPAQPVQLIDRGVLVGVLNGHATVWAGDSGNGHGRGHPAVSRMGNTILTHSSPVPRDSLREQLRRAAREKGLPYGLLIQKLHGGYTITGRELPQSFQLLALSAYRVRTDGGPDELIRGINLSGSPLSALSHLIGASDQTAVFNGFCGAENGWVPVSAVAPDLLFSTMEGEVQPVRSGLLPILAPPPEGVQ